MMRFCQYRVVLFVLILINYISIGHSWSKPSVCFSKKAISSISIFAGFPKNLAPMLVLEGIVNPEPAHAAASDAIDLLTGYKTHIPDYITWVVLIAGAYTMQYRIFKFLSTL